MSDDKRSHDDLELRSGYPDRRPNEPAEPTAGPEGDDPGDDDD